MESLQDDADVALVAAAAHASQDDLEDIKWLSGILKNSANDAPTRSGAALRLLNMGIPQAIAPLQEALLSGEPGLMLPVIDAVAKAAHAPPELLDPLVQALRTPPESVLGPLAFAVARYGDAALESVRRSARDQQLPVEQRLGPIHALGSFRNQAAAIELMAILEEDEANEPVVAATCAALRRGTGLPYGNDPEDWKRWWRDAVNQPPEQWLTNLVQRLADQLAEERKNTVQERETAAALEQRFGDFLREYFPLIRDEEEQMRRLRALMDDRLESVRLFAVGRVDRLLRDSIPIPSDVQSKLAELLHDESPEIRRRTARLLDQLNADSAGERIAQRLGVETSPDVATALMDILVKRPTAAAVAPIQRWLADPAPAVSDRAASAAWDITAVVQLDAQQSAALAGVVRAVDRWSQSPEHARLVGAVGTDEDLHAIEPLLDSGAPALRVAVAEAFLRRGVRQPLLDRAADAHVYPIAIRSLGQGAIDLSNVRRAIALPPTTEAGRTVWNETLVKIAGKLTPQGVLEMDDLLASLPAQLAMNGIVQLRANVLARGRQAIGEATDAEVRVELLTRLARQLLELDQPQPAYEAMATVNGVQLDESTIRVKFESAVRARHYDVAAQLEDRPQPWLDLLARLTERGVASAVELRDEIDRRFAGRLDDDLKAEFDRLSNRILREHVDADSGPSA